MFRHPEDRASVAFAALLTAVDFALYFAVDDLRVLAAYWLVMLVPKGVLGAWAHHHQHVPTFRATWANRALELCHALHTGVTTNLWVLHHVLGHHVNYLDQTKDESRWRRKDGSVMGMVEYSLVVAATAYYRGFRVGQRHRKHQRPFLFWSALTFGLVGLLVWHRPGPALLLFVLPMVCSLIFTTWVTYDHHAGLPNGSPYEASYNILNRRLNQLTGNLGLHTAHHLRQGVHWSRLPALHVEIRDKIPAHLYRETSFQFLLGSAEIALPGDPPSSALEPMAEPDVQAPEVRAAMAERDEPAFVRTS